jgi:hypothetical protein
MAIGNTENFSLSLMLPSRCFFKVLLTTFVSGGDGGSSGKSDSMQPFAGSTDLLPQKRIHRLGCRDPHFRLGVDPPPCSQRCVKSRCQNSANRSLSRASLV